MQRTRDDATVELADRERRRHVGASVGDGDHARGRVREQDVEVAP
jgi:hypothetical protein